MNARDSEILRFLNSPVIQDSSLLKAKAVLASLADELESCPDPRFVDLVNRRILASTSLSRKLEEREEWDAANAFIAKAIEGGEALEFGSLKKLNGILTKSLGEFREVAVFGCDDEYLTTASFAEAFKVFERFNAEPDPVLRAAYLYIFIINVHPFLNGNGRCARLAADWVLLENGYPALCFQSSISSHVAYAQASRYPSMNDCVLKVYAALRNSFEILLGRG